MGGCVDELISDFELDQYSTPQIENKNEKSPKNPPMAYTPWLIPPMAYIPHQIFFIKSMEGFS